ncbi:uncharacterized protein LOC132945678 [Metopolophium dirhodum]|uniref:uncharacterized protein LOC132945678 n=1 Tax=Metopolophium dirhodum TaxID=44670 RepID=UPI00298FD2FD|nr:uncharacterized protein LOC132945678 [Metopolophium dirhodum]
MDRVNGSVMEMCSDQLDNRSGKSLRIENVPDKIENLTEVNSITYTHSCEKKKISRRKLLNEFGEGSSITQNYFSSSDDTEFSKLCDDNSDDDIDDGGETCLICEERGKNEIWYRCTICGFWIHSECSGVVKDYECDICRN